MNAFAKPYQGRQLIRRRQVSIRIHFEYRLRMSFKRWSATTRIVGCSAWVAEWVYRINTAASFLTHL